MARLYEGIVSLRQSVQYCRRKTEGPLSKTRENLAWAKRRHLQRELHNSRDHVRPVLCSCRSFYNKSELLQRQCLWIQRLPKAAVKPSSEKRAERLSLHISSTYGIELNKERSCTNPLSQKAGLANSPFRILSYHCARA